MSSTIVTAEAGLKCTEEEADQIAKLLDYSAEADIFRFRFVYYDGEGFLEAEENGTWGELPDAALDLVGKLRRFWPSKTPVPRTASPMHNFTSWKSEACASPS
jgi:hypothetical protein